MSRRNDPAGLIAILVVGAILMLSIKLGAPFKTTLISIFSGLCILALYGFYFYYSHGSRFGYSSWQRSDRFWRVWSVALVIIYWVFIPVIDQAGTVEYQSMFIEKKKFLFDTETPWYSLWYIKVVISISIVLGGNLLHRGVANLWYKNVGSF